MSSILNLALNYEPGFIKFIIGLCEVQTLTVVRTKTSL